MKAAIEARPGALPAFRNGLARKAAGLLERHYRRRRLWRRLLAGSLKNRSASQSGLKKPT